MPMELKNGASSPRWRPSQVYAMGGLCLALGLLLGYLFRDSGSQPVRSDPGTAKTSFAHPASTAPGAQTMPTLEKLKNMADQQAVPLLAKLKSDPTNAGVLDQLGTIYRSTHQFEKAAEYYKKSLQFAPRNVATRTDLASCLYYQGNIDEALAQLQQSLQYDPKDANSLFNLGMMQWQGKKDATSAVTAWRQLLKANPKLDTAKRDEVKKLIAQVNQQKLVK